jgi:LppX_LprAFG lipoprotein
MKSMKRYPLLFLGLALAMLIMSACGQSSSSTSSSSSNTSSNQAPLEVLQKSANAMQNLKTLHIDLDETFQVNGASSVSSQTLSNMVVTVKGSGEQSVPDKQQKMDLTLTMPNLSTQVSNVVINDKVYIKMGQGQWYVVDKSSSDYTGTSVFSSTTTIDYNNLLSLVEHTEVTDHGVENVDGQSLRHISAKLKKDAFQQLMPDNLHLKSSFGSLDLNTVKNFTASVDVYIDETEFYVHRFVLKGNQDMDGNSLTASGTIDLTINLSEFNQPVTITEPANATPLTDSTQLLDGLSLDGIESWYGKQDDWISIYR